VTAGSATVARVPARVPCLRRATAVVAVAGVAAIVGVGCGSDRRATGFCASIQRGHAGFDSTDDVADRTRALAQLERVIASAPATVAPDLKTVGATVADYYRDPKAVLKDPAILHRYTAALDRVDQYLRDACGLRIPRRRTG
jgi:hypothetical protein